jgi:Geminivirus Rep catalytic domain.
MEQPKKFRLNGKGFFLTYPQCPLSKEQVHEHLATLGEIVNGVIAEEKHEDGSPHVHAYIRFAKEKDVRKPEYFDIGEYHGNYQTAKSSIAAARYCKKDGVFLEIGDIDILGEKVAREGKRKILGKRLAEGDSLVDLIQEGHHQLIFGFQKLQADIKAYQELVERNKPTCEETIPNTWDLALPLLEHKQRHYWLWSDQPNLGKTTFLKKLATDYRCSWYNQAETFQQIHADSQFILLDEYSSAVLKVTQLNQMADGTYQYP